MDCYVVLMRLDALAQLRAMELADDLLDLGDRDAAWVRTRDEEGWHSAAATLERKSARADGPDRRIDG